MKKTQVKRYQNHARPGYHKQLSYRYASMTVKLWASQQFYSSSKRNVRSKVQRGWQFFFTDKHIATDKIVSCLPRSHPHWTYNRWLNKNRFLVKYTMNNIGLWVAFLPDWLNFPYIHNEDVIFLIIFQNSCPFFLSSRWQSHTKRGCDRR